MIAFERRAYYLSNLLLTVDQPNVHIFRGNASPSLHMSCLINAKFLKSWSNQSLQSKWSP